MALLLSKGRLSSIRSAWQSGAFRPVVSRDTVNELIRVLCCPKFQLTEDDRLELLDDYLRWCESLDIPDSTKAIDCRGPSDRPLLALALASDAEAIVTGDQNLLVLSGEFPSRTISPQEFRNELSAS